MAVERVASLVLGRHGDDRCLFRIGRELYLGDCYSQLPCSGPSLRIVLREWHRSDLSAINIPREEIAVDFGPHGLEVVMKLLLL